MLPRLLVDDAFRTRIIERHVSDPVVDAMQSKFAVCTIAAVVGLLAFSKSASTQYYQRWGGPVYQPPPVMYGPMPGSTPMMIPGARPYSLPSPGGMVMGYLRRYNPASTVMTYFGRSALGYGAAEYGAEGVARFVNPNPWIAAGTILFLPNVAR